MKRLISNIFIALSMLAMVSFFAPQTAIAEQTETAPGCETILVTCDDGSVHGYALVCDKKDRDILNDIYCNTHETPVGGAADD